VIEQNVEGVSEVSFRMPQVELVDVAFHFDEAEEGFEISFFVLIVLESVTNESNILWVFCIE